MQETWDTGLIPRSGRSRVGNGNPFQYSCLENSMGRGAWQAMDHGVTKSQTRLKQLSRQRAVRKKAMNEAEVMWRVSILQNYGCSKSQRPSACTTGHLGSSSTRLPPLDKPIQQAGLLQGVGSSIHPAKLHQTLLQGAGSKLLVSLPGSCPAVPTRSKTRASFHLVSWVVVSFCL